MHDIRQVTVSGWNKPVDITGNETLLQQHKAAYLCSLKYPPKSVMPSMTWAENARNSGQCVISGFHSLLEEDVRDILLPGDSPLIWVIPRAIYTRQKMPAWAKQLLTSRRLLIISTNKASRGGEKDAAVRNRFILSVADKIAIGYAAPGGNLAQVLEKISRPVTYLS